jgi:type 1 glutamine amidotransferase
MKTFGQFVAVLAAFTVGCVARHDAQTGRAPKKILFFSRSGEFEHPMVAEKDGQPSKAQVLLTELGKKNNFEFTFTKDGSVFTPENIARYDAFFFYTQGENLSEPAKDGSPPMSKEGEAAFLEAIHHGKGFVGTHSASDTCHSPGSRWMLNSDDVNPYIKMIGGEFIVHGSQQKAHQIVIDSHFPGMSAVPDDFGPNEEWYSLKNFAPDLHVLLVQDTSSMQKEGDNKKAYDRPNYPSTWAHKYGQGRVFYTSMGHRDDVWDNPVFQSVLIGGINWVVGNVEADITPNLKTAAPEANVLPPQKQKD